MKFLGFIFPIFIVLTSLLGFTEAQGAASSNAPFLCANKDHTVIRWAEKAATSPTYSCPTNTPDKADVQGTIPADSKSVCVTDTPSPFLGTVYVIRPLDTQSCQSYKQPGTNVSLRSVSGGGTTTQTPPIIAPTNQTPSTTQTPTTTKPTTTTTKPTTTKPTTTGSQGSCPNGFVEKGPLCVPNNPFGSSDGIAGNGTISGLALTIINIMLGLAGIVAVIMIIVGGYQWMTARGNETQVTNGRKTVINALIGLIIVVVSFAIVQAVNNFLVKGL